MNSSTTLLRLAMLLSLLAFETAVAVAAETVFNLTAGSTTITMPDGNNITMWGYALDNGPVSVPGPVLTVPPGDSLRINLTNNLPGNEPVSIMLPGQAMPLNGPGGSVQVTRNPDNRIRSFTHETPTGETGVYVWPVIKPGTYIYQSATHQAVHVQMGLYGALTKNAAPNTAYPGVPYDQDLVLLYSEIDPALHAAVRDGIYGTAAYPSTIYYKPDYHLINGQPFTEALNNFPQVNAGSRILLRFLNAGLKTHEPTLLDLYATLIAEDGNPYPHPREQCSLMLPAAKTIDAVVVPNDNHRYPIYDHTLALANGMLNAPGGMLTYFNAIPNLNLTSPNGGESWALGSTHAVTWKGGAIGPSVKLKLWRNNVFTGYFLTGTIANNGSFSWKIPETLTAGDGYAIQVYTPNYAYSDFSDNTFTLAPKITLTVTSPNGGESWAQGSTHAITWNGPDVGPSVKIRLWRNGTFTGYYLTGTIANNGSFDWRIPNGLPTGDGYKIQIYTPNYAYNDFSDNPFSIAPKATLTLTTPNGGESWALGSTQSITWNGPDVGPVVKMRLWRNGVFTGYFLAGAITNNGSFNWKIPTSLNPGAGYRIQIYTPNYAYTDFSDNDFSLTAPITLTVTSPNGGESWALGSTQSITWNGPDVGPVVKIRLWRNGAFTGYFLAGAIANNGSFAWTIPNTLTPGPGYRIQIYTPNYAYRDFSNNDFSLTP